MAGEKKQTYPSIPTKNWWDLRKRFMQSPPKQVKADYLQSILGLDEGAAKNLIPPLRRLGLIDEDNVLTELAHDWRSDEHYAEARKRMREAIYPQELRDAFPTSSVERETVEKWFMRNTKTGEAASRRMASLYLLLLDANPETQQIQEPGRSKPAKKEKPTRSGARSKPTPAAAPTTAHEIAPNSGTPHKSTRTHGTAGPDLHVDIQIHIAANASAEQIEAIFASMAKHLYRRGE